MSKKYIGLNKKIKYYKYTKILFNREVYFRRLHYLHLTLIFHLMDYDVLHPIDKFQEV